MSVVSDLKRQVLDTAKLAYSEALFAGTSGNLSAFDRASGQVVITPTSLSYAKMAIEDIVVTDLDGLLIEGCRQPSSEWRMHTVIYRARPDVAAVVHTHSPYATSFAVSHKKVPLVLIEMIPFIGGDIPLAEFALPGTEELGIEALKVLKDRNACLLSNHGVLAVGATVEETHLRAVYVEDASKIYHLAVTAGEARLIPEEAARAMMKRLRVP